jgi:hypothetical protein
VGVFLGHEWIYRMLWDDKRAGGDLWRFLRRRGKKYNRRRAQHAGRGMIPPRVHIAERPAIVNSKSRLGDWEGDTIVGAQHNGVLLTHVERKSLFTTISKLGPSDGPGRSARHSASADSVARRRPHHHLRQRQRVRRTSKNTPRASLPGPILGGNAACTRTRMASSETSR